MKPPRKPNETKQWLKSMKAAFENIDRFEKKGNFWACFLMCCYMAYGFAKLDVERKRGAK